MVQDFSPIENVRWFHHVVIDPFVIQRLKIKKKKNNQSTSKTKLSTFEYQKIKI